MIRFSMEAGIGNLKYENWFGKLKKKTAEVA